jgi:cell division protein ZapA (FtsZ GTPase activity inhibitor)
MEAQNFLRFRMDSIDYTLRGDMSQERMELIVKKVEEKVNAIREQAPYYSQARVATLAALQISEELLELKSEYAAFAGEANVGAETLF